MTEIVVVVGGDPVGLTTAIFAARNNYKVQIEDNDGEEYLIEKSKLSSLLEEYINKHYESEIRIQKYEKLSVDFDKKVVKCQENDAGVEFDYNLLIVSNEKFRSLLEDNSIIQTQVKYESLEINCIYGPFTLLDFQTPHLQNHFQAQGQSLLYIKPHPNINDKNTSIIIFNQHSDYFVQITCPKILQQEFKVNNTSFSNYLREKYEDIIPGEWISKIKYENCTNKGQISKLVSCRSDGTKNVVLLGDAAHTVPGIFNQDLNFGLCDCEVLDYVFKQISEKKQNINQTTSFFIKKRQAEIVALETIELCGLLPTTKAKELLCSQIYSLYVLIIPNIIILQLVNIFLPWYSRHMFMRRMKNANVSFQKILQEMWVVAIWGWILGIVFIILFTYLVVQFLLVYFFRFGALERFESMLRLVNEAFHFV
eukprot:TRINITY_DN20144_c0_g3_i2.p1 TRINITY_DN20144_c0_g3~~TRINITY_DN20144_c0_g3_i2.p1  ORF type:complete len:424 (-),score=22.01 TRINITY_DN20144_c0_g3_i2:394-1665(-)